MNSLKELYLGHPNVDKLCNEFLNDTDKPGSYLKGLLGSAKALTLAAFFEKTGRQVLLILPDKEIAAYLYTDLKNILSEEKVSFLPSSYKRSVQYGEMDNENIVLRTETLSRLQKPDEPVICVTYPEGLIEKVIKKDELDSNTLNFFVGEKVSPDFIIEFLQEYEFERTDFVIEPGQFALRGSIVDIFSYSNENPYRIDFFGDEVESIRTFDIENQLSKEKIESCVIIPNIQNDRISGDKVSLFEFINSSASIWTEDWKYTLDRLEIVQKGALDRFLSEDVNPLKFIETTEKLSTLIESFHVTEFGSKKVREKSSVIEFQMSLQPVFKKSFELLANDLDENIRNGYTNFILSDSSKQIERISSILKESGHNAEFNASKPSLHEGFKDHQIGISVYTDHQIFERYHRFEVKSKFTKKDSISLKELQNLNPGDYVVHIDHGVGKFGGLESVEMNGRKQEAVRLVFKDNDILYVNIHSLHRVSKYKSSEGEPPKLNKLGTATWQKIKQKTKSKVKDIARDLIALYSKRRAEEGFRFSPDSYLNKELEASFLYEDTPDQESATTSVKQDMEAGFPMDRLICGDVGFGKTEIAIRAAFKAVADSKQVAVLVPTTILALQHFNTFTERLKGFPAKVDYISRLKSAKEQKITLENLQAGKTDIIIGTHRIIGKDIKFKDLGLLIIDEEQKFGVAVKEKLKAMKINVDTLTLTATPIPRTLQFSLLGARDLSVINTPPPNRHPILTELHTFNESIIREAILFEIERDGQVFFINNRIQNIFEVEKMIHDLCPGIKTGVAHGQLEGDKLEQVMLDFIEGKFDVLIATTIIENGLDIPNANTIIINEAHHYGLSDLHQLRGRVGRSNKKAFCYLLAPPLTMVTQEARRRLKAIEEFSELGSGFSIAMRDLDIRGAGNMLGAEQSGFIADIGYETYQRILDEALFELKETEFRDSVFDDSGIPSESKKVDKEYITDCVIDTDLELLLPQEYIGNTAERINLYRELDNIKNEEELDRYTVSLIDRFGEIPAPTEELLKVVRLRWTALFLGFEKLVLKNAKMVAYFISDQHSGYYKSRIFAEIVNYIQKKGRNFSLKEKNDKLTMTVESIDSVRKAAMCLDSIREFLEQDKVQ